VGIINKISGKIAKNQPSHFAKTYFLRHIFGKAIYAHDYSLFKNSIRCLSLAFPTKMQKNYCFFCWAHAYKDRLIEA
jgi:hypothetical protein